MRTTVLVLVHAGASAAAETKIHRCTLEDGTIAFQETPCPESGIDTDAEGVIDDTDESTTSAAGDGAMDFVNLSRNQLIRSL